jgi:hypothetical protein
MQTDDWLYVAKPPGQFRFIKMFKRFNPEKVKWTTDLREAALLTESEWYHSGALGDLRIVYHDRITNDYERLWAFIKGNYQIDGKPGFIQAHRLCLVSYDDNNFFLHMTKSSPRARHKIMMTKTSLLRHLHLIPTGTNGSLPK